MAVGIGTGGTGPRPDERSRHHRGFPNRVHVDGVPTGVETDWSEDEIGP